MQTTIETKVTENIVRLETKVPPTHIQNRWQTGTTATMVVDVAALERDLRSSIKGEVRFGDGDRGMYASDAGNYRMIPMGIVLPKDADDVLAALDACRRHGAPIFARGGGTGIPGQTVNTGLLLDF